MFTKAEITIYNRYPDKEKKEFVWRPTRIRGVHFYTDQKTVLDAGTGNITSADVYKIRVYPDSDTEGREYIDQKEYRQLSAEEVNRYWTLDSETVFVRGLTDCPYTELTGKFQYVGKVDSFSDNRDGPVPHIRIGGSA